jgi:hypothetical protein
MIFMDAPLVQVPMGIFVEGVGEVNRGGFCGLISSLNPICQVVISSFRDPEY